MQKKPTTWYCVNRNWIMNADKLLFLSENLKPCSFKICWTYTCSSSCWFNNNHTCIALQQYIFHAICNMPVFFQFCYYLERHSPVKCLVGRPRQTGKTYPFQSPAGHGWQTGHTHHSSEVSHALTWDEPSAHKTYRLIYHNATIVCTAFAEFIYIYI